MNTPLTPGVYIREVQDGPRPIEAVGVGLAGFIGDTPREDRHPGEPVMIRNWAEFRRTFVLEDSVGGNVLANAVFSYFINGGSLCYIVNAAGAPLGDPTSGLAALRDLEGVSLMAAPGRDEKADQTALLEAAEHADDRIAILDGPADEADLARLTAIGETGLKPGISARGRGAFYFPWIRIVDALDSSLRGASVPPSGHVMGVMARVAAERGVHKAPANEVLRGSLGLTRRVTAAEQGLLNPEGVNCLREFPRDGLRIWGARTLAPSASSWRYVNVRRTVDLIKLSIERGTRWVVFEPNDARLWQAITRDVSAFLTLVWRQGALHGEREQDAFFVKCDAETNPPSEVQNGRLNVEIGIRPVHPAEFVMFSISQNMGDPA